MDPFKSLREYVLEPNFSMNILKDKIDIINYEKIEHFDSNKIMVNCTNLLVIVEGSNLIISKLLKDEILITGSIKNIEFR